MDSYLNDGDSSHYDMEENVILSYIPSPKAIELITRNYQGKKNEEEDRELLKELLEHHADHPTLLKVEEYSMDEPGNPLVKPGALYMVHMPKEETRNSIRKNWIWDNAGGRKPTSNDDFNVKYHTLKTNPNIKRRSYFMKDQTGTKYDVKLIHIFEQQKENKHVDYKSEYEKLKKENEDLKKENEDLKKALIQFTM